ncbi:hypothetical protein NL676_007911 [Syzygium grande]|nr:hypothetical protein NL676_007911 [Syzygium grande]
MCRDLLKELLKELRGVPTITIGGWCLQIMSHLEMEGVSSPLSKFIHLTNLPRSKFELELDEESEDCVNFDGEELLCLRKGNLECLAKHLKRVEISGIGADRFGSNHLLALIKFLLGDALVLEKLVIEVKLPTHFVPGKLLGMVEEEEEEQHQLSPLKEPAGATHQEYSWPAIRFDVPPQRAYRFHTRFRTDQKPNNFLKGVKGSPDGTCLLSSSEDNTLRVFALPDYGGDDGTNASSSDLDYRSSRRFVFSLVADSFAANLVVTEGESVYDFCWYPYVSATDRVSCVFASTTRDHPIHVWDATTLQLRCTYRAYDAVDEITAAFSIAFNLAGNKILAGYNKSIRVFDVHRPGRDSEMHSTLQGIISAIALSPAHSGMLATGSYSQTTAIYREDNMELLYVLHGQLGGVTHGDGDGDKTMGVRTHGPAITVASEELSGWEESSPLLFLAGSFRLDAGEGDLTRCSLFI